MNVILSIKPKFAELILNGKKRYEYRKVVFKQPVSRIYLYASYPVCRIVGEFSPEDIISGAPVIVWSKTKEYSGIDQEYFEQYFQNKRSAYAIQVKAVKRYQSQIDPRQVIPDFRAPQSFCYIKNYIGE